MSNEHCGPFSWTRRTWRQLLDCASPLALSTALSDRPKAAEDCGTPRRPWLAAGWLAAAAALPVLGAESAWTPLFNERDLTGWVNVNCAPNTFSVRDRMIVST